jgi:hypothetical protein
VAAPVVVVAVARSGHCGSERVSEGGARDFWQDRQSRHQICLRAHQITRFTRLPTTYSTPTSSYNTTPIIQTIQFNSIQFNSILSIHPHPPPPVGRPPLHAAPSDLSVDGQFFSSLIQQNGRAAAASACRDFIGERRDETKSTLVHHTYPSLSKPAYLKRTVECLSDPSAVTSTWRK